MANKSTLPVEYREKKVKVAVFGSKKKVTRSHFDRWDVQKLVEDRIEKHLDSIDMPTKIRNRCEYRALVISRGWNRKTLMTDRLTRVYIGRWSKSVFVSSKVNQSIDLDVVAAAVMKHAAKQAEEDKAEKLQRGVREESNKLAEDLSKKYKLADRWDTNLSVDGCEEKDKVNITFDADISVEAAEKLVKILKPYERIEKNEEDGE
jgi:hypothetical protein